MVGRVVAGVEVMGVTPHVSVHVGGLYLVTEGVCVGEKEQSSAPVLRLDVSIVEGEHEALAQLEDGEDGVCGAVERQLRLQEMDGHHVVENPEGVELGLGELLDDGLLVAQQLDVRALPEILHRFPEHGVVH